MSGENKTVLVVEDDRLSRKLFQDVLLANGYSVLSAVDGLSAMTSVRKCRPDLIVLDIILPKVDGWQFLKLIKSDPGLRSIPVLAISAYLMAEQRQMLISLGAADLILKPISIIGLVRAVALLL